MSCRTTVLEKPSALQELGAEESMQPAGACWNTPEQEGKPLPHAISLQRPQLISKLNPVPPDKGKITFLWSSSIFAQQAMKSECENKKP